MMHFSILQKLARVPLKRRFRPTNIVPGKRDYILTFPQSNKNYSHEVPLPCDVTFCDLKSTLQIYLKICLLSHKFSIIESFGNTG